MVSRVVLQFSDFFSATFFQPDDLPRTPCWVFSRLLIIKHVWGQEMRLGRDQHKMIVKELLNIYTGPEIIPVPTILIGKYHNAYSIE